LTLSHIDFEDFKFQKKQESRRGSNYMEVSKWWRNLHFHWLG